TGVGNQVRHPCASFVMPLGAPVRRQRGRPMSRLLQMLDNQADVAEQAVGSAYSWRARGGGKLLDERGDVDRARSRCLIVAGSSPSPSGAGASSRSFNASSAARPATFFGTGAATRAGVKPARVAAGRPHR